MGTPTLNQLATRVSALDGVGTAVPTSAQVPVIKTDLNGIHTTINQLTLTIQSQLNAVAQQISQMQTALSTLLGVTNPIPFIQGTTLQYQITNTDVTNGGVDLTVTWPVAFADTNYVADQNVEVVSGSIDTYYVGGFSKTASTVTVSVGGANLGDIIKVHCIGMHF